MIPIETASKLVDRLERGEQTLILDRDIGLAIEPGVYVPGTPMCLFTTNFSAARRLVPIGWHVALMYQMPTKAEVWHARIQERVGTMKVMRRNDVDICIERHFEGWAPTPEAALCIAAILQRTG